MSLASALYTVLTPASANEHGSPYEDGSNHLWTKYYHGKTYSSWAQSQPIISPSRLQLHGAAVCVPAAVAPILRHSVSQSLNIEIIAIGWGSQVTLWWKRLRKVQHRNSSWRNHRNLAWPVLLIRQFSELRHPFPGIYTDLLPARQKDMGQRCPPQTLGILACTI